MTIAVPKVGELIRYSYLWHDEYQAGREQFDGLNSVGTSVNLSQ